MTEHDLPHKWIAAVQDALRGMGETRWNEAVAARWRERAEEPGVFVTAYGPYDAGKTALIKRLLVEDATDPPRWLAVGGQPMTDTCRQVASGGLVYVDTPGTASGNHSADEIAHDAATLTDVLLFVVTPQLLGSDSERTVTTVREAFAAEPRSVVFVIAQSENHLDPSDDPDGYRVQIDHKRAEFLGLLAARDIPAPESAVHAISADPFGLVRSTPTPTPADYAAGAGWDGIHELRRELSALPAHRSALRRASGIRYWRTIGARAIASVGEHVTILRSSIEDAHRLKEQAKLVEKQLDEADSAATEELRAAVQNELLSAAGAVRTPTIDALLPVLEQRLQARLGAWLSVWSGQLRHVAESARTAAPGNMPHPSAGTFRSYLERVIQTAEAPTDDTADRWRVEAIVSRADRHVGSLAGQFFKHRHGMSIEVARAELEKLQELDASTLAGYFAAGGKFSDAKHVESVKNSLRTTDLVTGVLPVVVEFGALAYTDIRNQIEARKARRRRAELQASIERTTNEIVARVLGAEAAGGVGWTDAVESIRQDLRSRVPDEEVLNSMAEEHALLEAAQQDLNAVLAEAPSP
jgi:hypothetical protein